MMKTSEFKFHRVTGLLARGEWTGPFPARLEVMSDATGVVVEFAIDETAAEAAEYWDGEEMQYRPVTGITRVSRLVLSRAPF